MADGIFGDVSAGRRLVRVGGPQCVGRPLRRSRMYGSSACPVAAWNPAGRRPPGRLSTPGVSVHTGLSVRTELSIHTELMRTRLARSCTPPAWRAGWPGCRCRPATGRATSSVCGVRCAVCGVRCAVCGVRCAVCGSRRRGSALDLCRSGPVVGRGCWVAWAVCVLRGRGSRCAARVWLRPWFVRSRWRCLFRVTLELNCIGASLRAAGLGDCCGLDVCSLLVELGG